MRLSESPPYFKFNVRLATGTALQFALALPYFIADFGLMLNCQAVELKLQHREKHSHGGTELYIFGQVSTKSEGGV